MSDSALRLTVAWCQDVKHAMSYMLEVYYQEPADLTREERMTECARMHGGRLDYREPPVRVGGPVCLTFEFTKADQATAAAEAFRGRGEHVEGPSEYGS